MTSAGISGLGNVCARRSLPFVNVVDGNCPELLFRELGWSLPATSHDECAFQNWSWWLKFGACMTGCISGVMARDMGSRGGPAPL